jgi:hypothetical protein
MKQTRHLAIRYFFITDYVVKKECKIVWIPWEDMAADYLENLCRAASFGDSGTLLWELHRC